MAVLTTCLLNDLLLLSMSAAPATSLTPIYQLWYSCLEKKKKNQSFLCSMRRLILLTPSTPISCPLSYPALPTATAHPLTSESKWRSSTLYSQECLPWASHFSLLNPEWNIRHELAHIFQWVLYRVAYNGVLRAIVYGRCVAKKAAPLMWMCFSGEADSGVLYVCVHANRQWNPGGHVCVYAELEEQLNPRYRWVGKWARKWIYKLSWFVTLTKQA